MSEQHAAGSAPELAIEGPWLNSGPLSMKSLRGKTVLLDFWTYSCTNCLHTLAHLKRWQEEYGRTGFVIIGVHTPEFQFESDVANVRHFAETHGISWPIVIDNEHRLWDAYQNASWPVMVLIDARGTIRYSHVGEGAYDETEQAIRSLLAETDPELDFGGLTVPSQPAAGAACYPMTDKTYCGYARGRYDESQDVRPNVAAFYSLPAKREEGIIYLDGPWVSTSECLMRPADATGTSSVVVNYRGMEVNAVMAPGAGGTSGVNVMRDSYPLTERARGADLMVPGRFTIVQVARPAMYSLVRDPEYDKHELRLETKDPGVRLYVFTFAACET